MGIYSHPVSHGEAGCCHSANPLSGVVARCPRSPPIGNPIGGVRARALPLGHGRAGDPATKRGSNQGSCRQAGFEPGQSGPGTTQPALDRGGLATFPIYDLWDPVLARFWADSPANDLRQGAPFDARRRTGPANARSRRKRGATSAKARRRPCSTPPGRGRPRRPWVIYRGIRQRSPNQRDREVIYRESRPGQMRGALRHRPGRRWEPSAGGRARAFSASLCAGDAVRAWGGRSWPSQSEAGAARTRFPRRPPQRTRTRAPPDDPSGVRHRASPRPHNGC